MNTHRVAFICGANNGGPGVGLIKYGCPIFYCDPNIIPLFLERQKHGKKDKKNSKDAGNNTQLIKQIFEPRPKPCGQHKSCCYIQHKKPCYHKAATSQECIEKVKKTVPGKHRKNSRPAAEPVFNDINRLFCKLFSFIKFGGSEHVILRFAQTVELGIGYTNIQPECT